MFSMKIVRASLAALLMAAAPWAAAQTEKITLRLDWVPWGTHAPFHLAQSKGWFKDAGLDVEIEDGNGSVTTVQLVGNSKFDAGHASLAPMIIARDKGLAIKGIAVFVRKNDIALLVPRGGSIKSPADLAGKKLIYTAGSLEAPFLDAFLAAGKLKRDQVELVAVDAAAKVPTYLANRGDAVFSSAPFVLPIVAGPRASEGVMFGDYGLNFPGFGLVASEEKIKARGPALRRFASVVAGAWTYILAGKQDEAVAAVIAARPQAKLDPKVLRGQIDGAAALFNTPASANMPVGFMADADMAMGIKTLTDGKLISGGKSADFYTNDLLDPALIKRISGR